MLKKHQLKRKVKKVKKKSVEKPPVKKKAVEKPPVKKKAVEKPKSVEKPEWKVKMEARIEAAKEETKLRHKQEASYAPSQKLTDLYWKKDKTEEEMMEVWLKNEGEI